MTTEEKIIVSAYTGVLVCDFSDLHGYIEKLLDRPVWTHEMASEEFFANIKEKAKPDFLKLCASKD